MELKVTGNITQIKDDYCEAVKQFRNDNLYNVILTFAEPKTIHTSSYRKDDVTDTIHTVKRLFFLDKKGLANCMHEPNAEAERVCYVPKRKRATGYALDLWGLQKLEVVPVVEKDYSKNWQAIATSMRKYNINLDIAEAMETGLAGKTVCDSEFCKRDNRPPTHTHFCGNYYDMKKDKPRLMSFADVVNRFGQDMTIDRMKELATKSTYGDYKVYHHRKDGMKRDRSIDLQVYPDGKMTFNSASEYAGCGNGSYYLMFSPTMSFYCEND